MSAEAVEVLEMLSHRMIDVDEAIRLLKAIRKATGKMTINRIPAPTVNSTDALMEMVGSALRSEFSYGNIIAR